MVKKLIKYDFASYLRLLLPVQLILLGIAGLNRLVQIFEQADSSVYRTVFTSSIVLYVIAVIVCLLLTLIVAIVRFYQGMYTNEGYLSHTLPVTPTQHIVSKLIVSLIFLLGTLLSIFVSACVATLGEVNIELWKAGFYLLRRAYEVVHTSLIFYIIEFILMALAVSAMTLLKLYFCISVGQLAKKKKVLLAFGVYFGLYFIRQVLGTITIIIVTVNREFVENIMEWINEYQEAFFHVSLCGGIVFSLIIGAVYFFITRYIMSKRLNLT
jgi:hypothetical protein